MLKFSIIFSIVPVFALLYLYLRWRPRPIAAVALVLSVLVVVGSRFAYRSWNIPLREPGIAVYSWFAQILMAVLAFVLLYSLFFDLGVKLPAWLIGKVRRRNAEYQQSRRQFLTQAGQGGVLWAAAASTGIGTGQMLAGPEVKEVNVPVPNLAPGLEGLRIVQLSDLHVGATIGREYVERVVKIANGLNADLVALTGDFVDGTVAELGSDVALLAGLKSTYGSFYCTGNHEFYSGVGPWLEHFRSLGVKVLENEHEVLEIKGAKLLIGGVHDRSVSRRGYAYVSSPAKALENARPVDYKILLAHQPRSCFEAAEAGFDLQLSGHTHAGQFFPFSIFAYFAHPYVKGLNRHADKMWVYVNQATGYWGPPVRFGVPAEITLLKLKAS